MEDGGPPLLRHLQAEDAHTDAVLQRMGVPDLKQQLLREMRSRECVAVQVRVLCVYVCACLYLTEGSSSFALPYNQPSHDLISLPTQDHGGPQQMHNTPSDPPPERIGPWLYWHTQQAKLLRRPAPHASSHSASDSSSSAPDNSRDAHADHTDSLAHSSTDVNSSSSTCSSRDSSFSISHSSSSEDLTDKGTSRSTGAAGASKTTAENVSRHSSAHTEVVVDEGVLQAARDFAWKKRGLRLGTFCFVYLYFSFS